MTVNEDFDIKKCHNAKKSQFSQKESKLSRHIYPINLCTKFGENQKVFRYSFRVRFEKAP